MLRQDNADMRLTPIGREIGLVSDARYARMRAKQNNIARIIEFSTTALPKSKVAPLFEQIGEVLPDKSVTFGDVCRRPLVKADDVKGFLPFEVDDETLNAAVVELKYAGYLKKEEAAVKEQQRLEAKLIPDGFDYAQIKALRIEAREKLASIRPLNLGQASRISGVSPADIAVLIVVLRQSEREQPKR